MTGEGRRDGHGRERDEADVADHPDEAGVTGEVDHDDVTGVTGEVDHARVVADADVLAADLLVGDPARAALDPLRSHSWLELVATQPLLDDAEAIVADLADEALAADWRRRVDDWAVVVDQPEGDHPALAAAYQGNAVHLLTFDERLRSPQAGANLRGVMDVSVRSPDAFAAVFDAGAVFEQLFDETYPGPDLDPRA